MTETDLLKYQTGVSHEDGFITCIIYNVSKSIIVPSTGFQIGKPNAIKKTFVFLLIDDLKTYASNQLEAKMQWDLMKKVTSDINIEIITVRT